MPSALLFLSLKAYHSYFQPFTVTQQDTDATSFDFLSSEELKYYRSSMVVGVFLIFMCCNRFVRACCRVLKMLLKKGKKNKIKQLKKLAKKEAQCENASTTAEESNDNVGVVAGE